MKHEFGASVMGAKANRRRVLAGSAALVAGGSALTSPAIARQDGASEVTLWISFTGPYVATTIAFGSFGCLRV